MPLAHCDWSTSAACRWICHATMRNGRYHVTPPHPVGPLHSLFQSLEPTTLIAFDFPIGLPRAYAERAGIQSFPAALRNFSAEFYTPATLPEEISLARPFYPARPGGTNKKQLTDALGVASPHDLLRRCDRKTANRNAACEIFWTLGANQVGRATICGWRDLLQPALIENRISIWPFDGELGDLLQKGGIIAAESYPAETYSHLGLERSFGKTTQQGRKSQAHQIFYWCKTNEVSLDFTLESQIANGFGPEKGGDNPFDSLIGLLGLIEVIQNPSALHEPTDPVIRCVESWILGMQP